ncbi:unnamed protein product [Sphenostylis stenocarpa]|uniref:Uncharacterized protein n=1 Tax=Sphenostylis stenocarpa TaxID=92480 RepID=A0AA86SAT6_9FABA|nr:unnamed protein product [Sphenostylis stenocarpa]
MVVVMMGRRIDIGGMNMQNLTYILLNFFESTLVDCIDLSNFSGNRGTLSKTVIPVTSLKGVGDEILVRVQGGTQE